MTSAQTAKYGIQSREGLHRLFEVKKVVCQCRPGVKWFKVVFVNNGFIGATNYNAWVVIRDGQEIFLPTDQLKPKDQVWVDYMLFPESTKK
jgi:hypothetical protein